MPNGGVSPLPREARPYQGLPAGLVTRMVAAVIDGILVVVVLLLGYVGLAGLLFLFDPLGFTFPDLDPVLSLTAGFVALVVYLTTAWWLSGRSYGCLVMGLRVLGPRGSSPGLLGALLRALLCAVFPAGLLWVAMSRENRSVQDLVLHTSVVYDWQPRGVPRTAGAGVSPPSATARPAPTRRRGRTRSPSGSTAGSTAPRRS